MQDILNQSSRIYNKKNKESDVITDAVYCAIIITPWNAWFEYVNK